jgi:hypothetical protein
MIRAELEAVSQLLKQDKVSSLHDIENIELGIE